jgi:DNA polymerase-3 subunit gamma/tau
VAEALSLYRRHRPRSFADVVGQEAVVRTLTNAVQQDKVHHAYLFVGSRGTGKTSMAKILASCLNCVNGPTIEPCGVCDACVSIASASSLDVIEMDAASHNSVDDIRELRERVALAPVSGTHKVYILDEAHMLSSQAWNAFLKTLEEPPPHTVFVLATTEANKVLPTVVDRCHRFDFQRPTAEQVAEVLARVAVAEQIELAVDARALLARKANGSFRDALKHLEQLVTYRGPQVEVDDVLAALGIVDAELLFDAVSAVGEGDPARALRAVDAVARAGRDPGQFARDLEEHARGVLVAQTLGEVPPSLRVTEELDRRLLAQAGEVGGGAVVALLDGLAAAMEAAKAGADPRVQLELALVKAAAPALDPSAQALLARVERLEAALSGDAPAARAPAAAPPAVAEPAASEPAADAAPVAAPRASAPPEAAPAPRRTETPQATTPVQAPTAVADAPVAGPVAVADPPVLAVSPASPVTEVPPEAGLDIDGIRNLWPAVLDTVRNQNAMLAALLEGANPVELVADELRLAFSESAGFLKRKAEDVGNREALGQAIQAVAGRPLKLVYELRADSDRSAPARPVAPVLGDDELVARVMAEFDAEELPPDGDDDQETP